MLIAEAKLDENFVVNQEFIGRISTPFHSDKSCH